MPKKIVYLFGASILTLIVAPMVDVEKNIGEISLSKGFETLLGALIRVILSSFFVAT